MLVHPLGHVCDMDQIQKLCRKNNLLLIEDTCETIEQNIKINLLALLENFLQSHLSISPYFGC